jgi:hypothetical protein
MVRMPVTKVGRFASGSARAPAQLPDRQVVLVERTAPVFQCGTRSS